MAKLNFTETQTGKKGCVPISNVISIADTGSQTLRPIARIQCKNGGKLFFEVDEWMPDLEINDRLNALPFVHLRLRETGAGIDINVQEIIDVKVATNERSFNDAVVVCSGGHSYQVCHDVEAAKEIIADLREQLKRE